MMIVAVTPENTKEWAELSHGLYPHHPVSYFTKPETEFLYMDENEAVGLISLSLRRDYVEGTHSSPVGYIEEIYVKPNHRKRGIAAEMAGYAKQWARENGCVELASDCILENEDSRRFHNRIGFSEANTIVCFTMQL